ncbi:MAG: YkvA family protein [Elainellaceae cyanobacterium]
MTDSTNQYSEQNFWDKLKNFAVYAGREVIEKALTLFYAAQRPETPVWAKTIIYSALAYFILPTDAIPDIAPFAGYTDDLATLVTALGAVAMCITPEVKAAARQQVQDWFGEAQSQPASGTQTDAPRTISID